MPEQLALVPTGYRIRPGMRVRIRRSWAFVVAAVEDFGETVVADRDLPPGGPPSSTRKYHACFLDVDPMPPDGGEEGR